MKIAIIIIATLQFLIFLLLGSYTSELSRLKVVIDEVRVSNLACGETWFCGECQRDPKKFREKGGFVTNYVRVGHGEPNNYSGQLRWPFTYPTCDQQGDRIRELEDRLRKRKSQ